MKNLLLILLISVFIVGCSGNNDSEAETSENKKEEMTESEALDHIEQITYRLVEAWEEEDGSFEQRSSLQAAIGRSESVMEEIKEGYEEQLTIIEEIEDFARYVRLGAEDGLDEKYVYIEIYLERIEEELEVFSQEYLNGKMPSSIKRFEPSTY